MLVVNTKLPKLCHARSGDIIRIPDESGNPQETLYMVCIFDKKNYRPMRPGMFQGLYDEDRPMFIVNIETGIATTMPHLSSRVEIVRNIYAEVKE